MLQISVTHPAPLSPVRRRATAVEGRALAFRPRVVLSTGTVAALDCLETGRASGGVQGGNLGTLLDGLAAWPEAVAVCVPASVCGIGLAAALRRLLRVRQAGLFGGRALEVLLPATAAGADADALLLMSELMDGGAGLVLDCTRVLPSPAAMERLPLTGVVLDAGLLWPRRPGPAVLLRLRAVLRACVDLDLAVLTRNIETEAQRAVLCGLGCTQGSGDLFGPVLRPTEAGIPALH